VKTQTRNKKLGTKNGGIITGVKKINESEPKRGEKWQNRTV